MGCAEMDDSYMVQTVKASLNTTKRIEEQLDKIDFVIQIGDISYAMGYSSMVCGIVTCNVYGHAKDIKNSSPTSGMSTLINWSL